jgi:hypothetical protein
MIDNAKKVLGGFAFGQNALGSAAGEAPKTPTAKNPQGDPKVLLDRNTKAAGEKARGKRLTAPKAATGKRTLAK